MAGNPLKHRVLSALAARAKSELGDDDATELDYACDHVSNGGTIAGLAKLIGVDIGKPISRSFLSGILNNVSDDARSRLEAARRESASALAEQATEIVDSAEPFPASVAKASLQAKTRHWLAERFAPDAFGQKPPTVNIVNAGTLMLEALRQPIERLRPVPADNVDAGAHDWRLPTPG
jgi:hypothetical protein